MAEKPKKIRAAISDFNRSLLIEEVGNTCPLCGKFEKTGEEMTNHHINHDPSISEYWNLIRICWTCHQDLTKFNTDGTREKRVKLVKRKLFRGFFGPSSISAMEIANQHGTVVILPAMVKELENKGFLRIHQSNVFTVGPSSSSPTLNAYAISGEGKIVFEKLFVNS